MEDEDDGGRAADGTALSGLSSLPVIICGERLCTIQEKRTSGPSVVRGNRWLATLSTKTTVTHSPVQA